MSKIYSLLILALFSFSSFAQWTTVTTDAVGDGASPALFDGTEFSYRYDQASDSLYFKLDIDNLSMSNSGAVGVNVMVNIPGGGSTFNFWGNDNTDPYHFLLTAWVTGSAPSNYSGTVGIGSGGSPNNVIMNNLSINVDVPNKSIVIGVDRNDLVPDMFFSGNSITVVAAAAVGSNMAWNDDLYQPGASITITKSSISIEEEEDLQLALYPNPATDFLNFPTSVNGSFEIFDVAGNPVLSGEVDASGRIDIQQLSSGMYVVKAGAQTAKFSKL